MKAVVCYGDNLVKYEEVAQPNIATNSVKIKVKACGICGSDIPRAVGTVAHHYPIILGHEFCGVVEEIADDVTHVKKGDKVIVAPLIPCFKCEDCDNGNYSLCSNYSFIGSRQQGGMADSIVVPKQNVIKLSDNITYKQGALFEVSTVALHALFQCNYKSGGTVAVLGSGTVGVFVLQWAKILGAKKVVVFDRDEKPLELSKKLGADEVINTLDENFKEQALSLTDNKGFDYVFETAGATATMKYCYELVKKKGNVCLVGTPTREITFTPREWEQINRKEFFLTGSWMSYSAPFPGKEWEMTKEYFENGKLKFEEDIFYKAFPMKDAQLAFNMFKEDRSKVKGRVLLVNEEVKYE